MRRLLPGGGRHAGTCIPARADPAHRRPRSPGELCARGWTEASEHTATFSTTGLTLPSVTGHEASSGPRAGTGDRIALSPNTPPTPAWAPPPTTLDGWGCWGAKEPSPPPPWDACPQCLLPVLSLSPGPCHPGPGAVLACGGGEAPPLPLVLNWWKVLFCSDGSPWWQEVCLTCPKAGEVTLGRI